MNVLEVQIHKNKKNKNNTSKGNLNEFPRKIQL